MSEITLTDEQILRASKILWNCGQFQTTRTQGEQTDIAMHYQLTCDDDDVHEYLAEAGMLVQDDLETYQWLSDESLEKLFAVQVIPNFVFTTS